MLEVLDRITPFASGNIDNEEENSAARDVAQEFMTKSEAAMRPRLLPLLVVLLFASPARADLKVAGHGLKLPPGFTVTEFAGDEFAHDCYTLTINPKGQVVVAGTTGFALTLTAPDMSALLLR